MVGADFSGPTAWSGDLRSPLLRQLTRDGLIRFLEAKLQRWDSIWWNGELISIPEAIGRASELLPSEGALCSRDEVLLPHRLSPGTEPLGEARSANASGP
jgi:hypothetical protein